MNTTVQSLLGQHFAFAHGRTGVLQQLLLTQSDVDRLLGASGGKEVEQILIELKMTNNIDQGIREGNAVLQAVAAWMRTEVEKMTPVAKRPVFSILWLEGDAPLLAYLLKTKKGLTAETSEEPISGMTAYNAADLRALVQENVEGPLPGHLVSFVRNTLQGDEMDARSIDTQVAQYVAATSLALARTSGSRQILLYVRHSIDLQNIRTALRLTDEQSDISLAYLMSGGTIPSAELAGSRENTLRAIARSDLGYHLTPALLKSDDTNGLERTLSEISAADIAAMWNVPLSIEPVFAFAAIAITQLKLLRMVLIGKRNGLSPQDIKQALPPFLSAAHYLS
ncbi:hypothetical protein COU76_04120 [Candidatus Peregrinibacteria bacterium CG10_big_fil_rev_8_21_14_0_10_49_10]|nr:MAG: hypothetical protein COU76_04120 [Candidatus Peregrinibacteria bacterium CG10_big_fil_rev_8_21_14_0_10_49_10]